MLRIYTDAIFELIGNIVTQRDSRHPYLKKPTKYKPGYYDFNETNTCFSMTVNTGLA